MFIFKSYCVILLHDDKENYKSKCHDCKVGMQSKVYIIKYFPFYSEKTDRETMRELMKNTEASNIY